MIKEKIFGFINNHPFFYLTCLVLITSFCVGGLSLLFSAGNPGSLPTSPQATELVRNPTIAESTRTGIVANEITATSPWNPSATVSTTYFPEAIASETPEELMSTIISTSNPRKPLDSLFIVSPEGLTMLIDGGSADSGILDNLRGRGVTRIDLLVATHPHEDHIGGLIQVLDALPVARVVTNGQPHTTVTYENFLDAILYSGAEYSEVRRGDTITLGELEFSVLSPDGTLGDDLNDNSLILRLTYGQTTFLFMGDAGFAVEDSMLAAGVPLKANILKVGHHGSCSATSVAFIRAVRPNVGIYSAGLNNQYGHPCEGTIASLNLYGVLVLGIDMNGSITVTVSEDGYRITNSASEEIGR
jgi:competence protein ComEC